MEVYEVNFGFAIFWYFHCSEQLLINEKNSQIKKEPRYLRGSFFIVQYFNNTNLGTNYTN